MESPAIIVDFFRPIWFQLLFPYRYSRLPVFGFLGCFLTICEPASHASHKKANLITKKANHKLPKLTVGYPECYLG